MKSQNEFLPKSLAVLPSLDAFNPGTDPADGGGASTVVSPFAPVNFKMISGCPLSLGAIVNYTELHMACNTEGGTTPINQIDNPERAMLLMGVPKPNAGWKMSLNLSNGPDSDTIEMTGMEGKYSVLRAAVVGTPLFEVPGLYYTLEPMSGLFETYLNINQTNEVLKLSYHNRKVFDVFSVSFLAKSNI